MCAKNGALVRAMNISKGSNIEMILVQPNPSVMSILEIAHLDRFFPILSKDEVKDKFPRL
jgi:anti-anti-sigma regulatory factor